MTFLLGGLGWSAGAFLGPKTPTAGLKRAACSLSLCDPPRGRAALADVHIDWGGDGYEVDASGGARAGRRRLRGAPGDLRT